MAFFGSFYAPRRLHWKLIFSFIESPVVCCERVALVGRGPARQHQSARLGIYTATASRNGRYFYTKEDGKKRFIIIFFSLLKANFFLLKVEASFTIGTGVRTEVLIGLWRMILKMVTTEASSLPMLNMALPIILCVWMRHERKVNSWCSMLGQVCGKMTDLFEYCVIPINKNLILKT